MTQETIEEIKDLMYKIKALESLATFKAELIWIDNKKVTKLSVLDSKVILEQEFKFDVLKAIADKLNACIGDQTEYLIEEYRAKLAKLILL